MISQSDNRISVLYIAATLCLSAAVMLPLPPMPGTVLAIVFLLAVALIGVPHGALDFFIAKGLMGKPSLLTQCAFLVGYLVIAVLSMILWLRFPSLAFCLFLVISIKHFSDDWLQQLPPALCLAIACTVLCAPALLHAGALKRVLEVLMITPDLTSPLITGMQGCALLAMGVMAFQFKGILSQGRLSLWQAAELILLIVSAIALPPLLHFTLYFCLLHSLKHWREVVIQTRKPFADLLAIASPIVLVTFAGGGLAYVFYADGNIEQGILRTVFIGLFGLTVSHMLLIHYWHAGNRAVCND